MSIAAKPSKLNYAFHNDNVRASLVLVLLALIMAALLLSADVSLGVTPWIIIACVLIAAAHFFIAWRRENVELKDAEYRAREFVNLNLTGKTPTQTTLLADETNRYIFAVFLHFNLSHEHLQYTLITVSKDNLQQEFLPPSQSSDYPVRPVHHLSASPTSSKVGKLSKLLFPYLSLRFIIAVSLGWYAVALLVHVLNSQDLGKAANDFGFISGLTILCTALTSLWNWFRTDHKLEQARHRAKQFLKLNLADQSPTQSILLADEPDRYILAVFLKSLPIPHFPTFTRIAITKQDYQPSFLPETEHPNYPITPLTNIPD